METKFNFNSQICTTREQSERLLSLGLKKETADMHHYRYSEGYWYIQACPPRGDSSSFIPAWSLHRLLSMLPDDAPKIYWILDGASITIESEETEETDSSHITRACDQKSGNDPGSSNVQSTGGAQECEENTEQNNETNEG